MLTNEEEFSPDYPGQGHDYQRQKKIISTRKMLAKVSLSEQERNYIFS